MSDETFYPRYYRSGAEMLRMGNIYLKEESLESAYVLYMKYLTLFLEKVHVVGNFFCRLRANFTSLCRFVATRNSRQCRRPREVT